MSRESRRVFRSPLTAAGKSNLRCKKASRDCLYSTAREDVSSINSMFKPATSTESKRNTRLFIQALIKRCQSSIRMPTV